MLYRRNISPSSFANHLHLDLIACSSCQIQMIATWNNSTPLQCYCFVPSHQPPDLLGAAVALQPMTRIVPIERQQKRANFLLDPVPKYGYNFAASPVAVIRQELTAAKIDAKSIFSTSWTRRSRNPLSGKKSSVSQSQSQLQRNS